MDDPRQVRAKLSAARTRLILDTPFIGALAMHLPLVAADARRCPTVATDARALYFNPGYIAGLTLAQTQFVLAHEALHCALGHFARRAHRVKRRWDVACDHAVNLLLVDEGLKPPAGVLRDPRLRGLSAEEIYPLIPEDTREAPLDGHAFDGDGARFGAGGGGAGTHGSRVASPNPPIPQGDFLWGGGLPVGRGTSFGAPPNPPRGLPVGRGTSFGAPGRGGDPVGELAAEAAALGRLGGGAPGEADAAGPASPEQPAELELAWRARLAAAAQQAARAGRLGASWRRAIDGLIEPRLPWRALLARHLMGVARDDYSFRRLSRREGEALLPSLHSAAVHVVAAIDVSRSISGGEIAEFLSELNALKGQVRARVTLHACDAQLCPEGPWVFETWEAMDPPPFLSGGGGTRFTPVFRWIEEAGLRPDVLLYFTDAQGEFPPAEPPYPVIWLVKGRAPVPWGERIPLN